MYYHCALSVLTILYEDFPKNVPAHLETKKLNKIKIRENVFDTFIEPFGSSLGVPPCIRYGWALPRWEEAEEYRGTDATNSSPTQVIRRIQQNVLQE